MHTSSEISRLRVSVAGTLAAASLALSTSAVLASCSLGQTSESRSDHSDVASPQHVTEKLSPVPGLVKEAIELSRDIEPATNATQDPLFTDSARRDAQLFTERLRTQNELSKRHGMYVKSVSVGDPDQDSFEISTTEDGIQVRFTVMSTIILGDGEDTETVEKRHMFAVFNKDLSTITKIHVFSLDEYRDEIKKDREPSSVRENPESSTSTTASTDF